MFQRRHYDYLAETLANSHCKANIAWECIVREITDALAKENLSFQPTRFREACGIKRKDADEHLNNVINIRGPSRIGGYGSNG